MGVLKISPYVYPGFSVQDKTRKTVANILRVCYEYFNDEHEISKEEIQSSVRKRHLVDARRCMAYVMRQNTKMVVVQIGKELNVDHSSVSHYTRTFQDLHGGSREFRELYEGLCIKLAQNNLL